MHNKEIKEGSEHRFPLFNLDLFRKIKDQWLQTSKTYLTMTHLRSPTGASIPSAS
jgi:hypothetical protein